MRKKSLLAALLTMTLCLASSVSAFAATGLSEQEQLIMDQLKAGIEVDGTTIQFPEAYLNQCENELMKNKEDVTAEQADVIFAKIDNVEQIAQENHLDTLAEIKSSEYIGDLVENVQAAAEVVDYKVDYNAAHEVVTVTGPDGNMVFTNKSVINQTGFDMTAPIVLGGVLVTLLAACTVVASKKKLFAKGMEA
jgi:competence protein ComGF